MIEHTRTINRRTFVAGSAVAVAGAAITSHPMQAFGVSASQKQAEAQAALAKLDTVNQKLHQAEGDFEYASYELEVAQAAMDEAQRKIDDANMRIEDLQDQLGTRARGMYRSGSITFLDVLLSANSFQAFTTNWGLLNDMNQADADMVAETKDLRTQVEEQKAVFAEQEKQAKLKTAEAERVKNEAVALQAEAEATYKSLSAEAAELVKQEQEARRKAEEAEAARRAQQQGTGAAQPSNPSGNKKPPVSGNTASGDNRPVLDGGGAVARGKQFLGTRYVLGGGGPDVFDCSGFVSYCLTGKFGRQLGTTYTMAKYPVVSNPQPGDMCWWWEHVGLYLGGGQMIHASYSNGKVVIDSVANIESGSMGRVTYRRYW